MVRNNTSSEFSRTGRREQQTERLQQQEKRLGTLADAKNKKEFFKQILPLLKPLKSYIKRRLRLAYLSFDIRTPLYTSDDFLDEVILEAYERYGQKRANLSLEEWLYRLANERLEKYLKKRGSIEKHRRSAEGLAQAELRGLEEIPFTGDAEGEVWFPEELDDSEYQKQDFLPPSSDSDPEQQLERKEEVQQIVRALARVPERDRIVFELSVLEGFSKEAVARISDVSPDEVPQIVDRVKKHVRQQLQAAQAPSDDHQHPLAS
jgi:RNA polymerase sigma factor (sigma-70 family)